MATSIIGLLVLLLFVVALIYCLIQAASLFPSVPAPIRNIAIVIVFLILFVVLLNLLGYGQALKMNGWSWSG